MTDTNRFGQYALNNVHQFLLKSAQGMPATWLGRRCALIFRKLTLKTRKNVIIDANIDGLDMRVHTNDNVSERKFLFMPQFFDTYERELIKEHLPKDGTFIDIGANAGIYTLTAAKYLSKSGQVLSFEPNPVVCERLTYNMQLNKFDDIVTIDSIGISDQSGHFSLCLDDTNLGGSSLVQMRSDDKDNVINIPCLTLLSALEKHKIKKINILKIDIEGAEDNALIPFFESASKELYPDYMIIENSPDQWKRDLPSALENAGYIKEKVTRMNIVWKNNNEK